MKCLLLFCCFLGMNFWLVNGMLIEVAFFSFSFFFLIMNVMLTPAVIANAMVLPDFLFILIMH